LAALHEAAVSLAALASSSTLPLLSQMAYSLPPQGAP
jgi:hypothetical protein